MRSLFSRRTPTQAHPLDIPTTQRLWAICAVLLDYPDEQTRLALYEQVESIVAQGQVPAELGQALGRFVTYARATPTRTLQQLYVESFDHTRKGCMYLTYANYGDTRRRGVALVEFKQAYRKVGLTLDTDELPDHMSVVLQCGAGTDFATGWKLLTNYRAGVELLRRGLREMDSPWHDVATVLCATLPALSGDEEQAIQILLREGPPAEDVGLQPDMIDPALMHATGGQAVTDRAPAPTPLGYPTVGPSTPLGQGGRL